MGTKNNESLREQLITAVLKKRAALSRAQNVVEILLEPKIEESMFLSLLTEISPSHYSDIVDERNISKICGYPLCSKSVDKVPIQKYQVCAIRNKVYDLTERKKFCCGYCFKASEYIKSQVPTSPLWLRDEEPKPKFQLLSHVS